jgi:peroxiredoxin
VTVGSAAELAGLKVGERAPAFDLKDYEGTSFKSEAVLKKGPLVIVFYRSADW